MKVIIFIAVSSCFVWCDVSKDKSEKENIEYWKPHYAENKTISKIKPINDKPYFRHSQVKPKKIQEKSSSKWPKVSKYNKRKGPDRMTKMQMVQEEDATKTSDVRLEEDNILEETLSPYNIKQQLIRLVKQISDINVTVDVIGRTVEYNDIVLLKISQSAATNDKYFRTDGGKYAEDIPEKKIIFIVHGLVIMGFNQIPCLTSAKEFHNLLDYYCSHLHIFDIFLIPMANPDGVAFLRSVIHWNKNTSPQNDCPGVALDRNFDIAWNNNRSVNSCHQQYPGPAPFSEVETKAIRDVFHKYGHKIVGYFNVHAGSYIDSTFKGDAVLYPKGYTDSISDDDKYIDLKAEIDEAMRNASFQVMSVAVDTLYSWYGMVAGSSVDYASTVYGIPFSMELVMQIYKNPEDMGYEPPPDYIDNALNEVWRRVTDVIFNFIWKTLNGNEVE